MAHTDYLIGQLLTVLYISVQSDQPRDATNSENSCTCSLGPWKKRDTYALLNANPTAACCKIPFSQSLVRSILLLQTTDILPVDGDEEVSAKVWLCGRKRHETDSPAWVER